MDEKRTFVRLECNYCCTLDTIETFDDDDHAFWLNSSRAGECPSCGSPMHSIGETDWMFEPGDEVYWAESGEQSTRHRIEAQLVNNGYFSTYRIIDDAGETHEVFESELAIFRNVKTT